MEPTTLSTLHTFVFIPQCKMSPCNDSKQGERLTGGETLPSQAKRDNQMYETPLQADTRFFTLSHDFETIVETLLFAHLQKEFTSESPLCFPSKSINSRIIQAQNAAVEQVHS
jgi:hypothetical protein